MERFVSEQADFAFEMRVLNKLRRLGFSCRHAGTFRDPITEKIRQFDVRAYYDRGAFRLRLAVESKNLRPSRPLLLHTVPRSAEEAFHELVVRLDIPRAAIGTKRLSGHQSIYKPGTFVGKQT